MHYDRQLSENRNEACAFCHKPETGFTGPVSELIETTGAYSDSVRTRFSNRKPQTLSYVALSPVLHYNPGQGGLVGGNFWNMRKQVAVWVTRPRIRRRPPTNPVEMALPDAVCAVYRASKRPHRGLFELVWGTQSFVIIKWSADVEAVYDTPGPPPDSGPPVWLDPTDRGRANASFDQMAQSIPDYEVSAEVTPLTSKRDAVQAGKAQFTRQEQLGYDLFRGKAKCNACS